MPRATRSKNLEDGKGEKSERKSGHKSTNSTGHDCTICRKSNMTLSGLKIHLLTHSGEKPYHCSVCDKRFTCSSNLKKHLRIHNKDYIYECEVCGKTCSDPSNMKKHMTVHSDEKAHVCPSCGKSYSYAQSLRQHMDDVHVESGEKRVKSKRKGHFPCPECGKVFGYYWRCSLHQDRVHAVEKPYKCPECGKAFARETILNKHLQTHEKPFPCTVCDRKFSFRDQLQKHNRIHSGEKPYQCETCLRAFSQRGSLTEHKRTHTGLKPFACSICGQKFSSSSSLRRHERKVKSCFPAPPGEEIPIGSMYPRKAIYVPTPPINIPQVETEPVVTKVSSPGFPSTPVSCASQISGSNCLPVGNGLNPTPSENVETNVNCQPSNTGQISMLVRCDKDGKISVVPVTLQMVNNTQLNGTNCKLDMSAANQPITTATSNHQPDHPNLDIYSQPNFLKPNTPVTMATSNNHSCDPNPALDYSQLTFSQQPTTSNKPTTYTNIPTTSQPISLIPTPITMETSSYHGNQYQPNLATNAPDNCVNQMNSQAATTASNRDKDLPIRHLTTTNVLQSFSSKPNPSVAVNPSKTIHHSATRPQLPTMEFTNNYKKSQSITNRNTTSNGVPASPVTVNGNLTTSINPPVVQNNDHTTWNYIVATPRRSDQPALGDVNNNMVSDKVYCLPVEYPTTSTNACDIPASIGSDSMKHHYKPVTRLEINHYANNGSLYVGNQPSIARHETTMYRLPVSITNVYQESPAHIPLHDTNGNPQSTLTKQKAIQPSCMKTEQEDVKPIIGVDVAVFN